MRERFLSSSTPVTCSSLHNKGQGYDLCWRSEDEAVEVMERFLSSSTPVTCSGLHNKGQGYGQGCGSGCGSVSGSGMDPDSIGSVDPDPGGQK